MTTIIKNGFIYDGSGRPPFKGDILIRGDRIIHFGNNVNRKTDKAIDANGAIVTPGFIDINNAADHYLDIFAKPEQETFLKQGITTLIGGNCGASLAPLIKGSLNPLRKWGESPKININWHSVREFLNTLKKKRLGINFGTLVGHSTIRRALTNDEIRDLTEGELAAFKKILNQALKEGAFGLSIGLEDVHSKHIHYYELLALAKIVSANKKIFATHLRDSKDGIENSIQETIKIAKQTGVNLEISHFLPIKKFKENYLKSKELIEKEISDTHINFDCHPFEFTASPIYKLLPERIQAENLEQMLMYVNTPHLKNELLAHFKNFTAKDLIIGYTAPSLKFLKNKSLKDFAKNSGLKTEEALLKLMRICHLRATVLYRNVDAKTIKDFLLSPVSIIASGNIGINDEHQIFLEFLKWFKDKTNLPLEKAIVKITSMPAQKYGINKRGLIKENYHADIVVIRDFKASEVLINGQIVVKDGKSQNALAGHILCAT